LAERGAALCLKKESLTKWERACDDALMAVVRKARFFALGPEPVFGFIFAKEMETRNLRVILSGKQSSVPKEEISERLRDPYV
jgi:V/A-type H+-transporting ATPase subunit C